MKNYSNKILLIIGIFVATLTFCNNFSLADSNSNEFFEIEQYQLVESIIYELDRENNINVTDNIIYKIYNCDNKLIYETRNNKDQKLKMLLNKSDLLTTIDNISYFKLSR